LASERCWLPVWNTRLYRRTAFTSAWPSAMNSVIGFSQYTSFPASQAWMAVSVCQWSGVLINTASMDLSSSIFR
jgi:hypothetical protein